jgi:hypothetical protein
MSNSAASAIPRQPGRPRGFVDEWRPQNKTLTLLDTIRAVLDEYADYLPITLRQLFYRLVGNHAYEKTERAYKNLGETMNMARRAGMIDFSAMRDDGALREAPRAWNFDEAVSSVRSFPEHYRLDRQTDQHCRQMVVSETAGMLPQLARIGDPYGVTVLSGGGFNSTTAKHDIAKEIVDILETEERPVRILHLGDYDPSGVHMFKNYSEDVAAFVDGLGGAAEDCRFERVAVTPEQIARLALPTAPRKAKDNRSFEGLDDDPNATVQLEAIAPDEIARILTETIEAEWDHAMAENVLQREREEQERLRRWLNTLPPPPRRRR